jgi:hypothetical protein
MDKTFKIANMKRTPDAGVVVKVVYIIEFEYNGIYDRHVGSVTLIGDPTSPDFVPFNELTEEIVTDWVKAELGETKLAEIDSTFQASLEAKYQAKQNPEFISGTPWGKPKLGSVDI